MTTRGIVSYVTTSREPKAGSLGVALVAAARAKKEGR